MYPQTLRSLPFADLRGARRAGADELRVTNAKADEAEIYLYGEIGFWGVTAADFQRELALVTAKHINLHVNSPGGEVFDGIAIYTLLREHEASVTTYIDGLAASAASFIALAGDRVVIAKSAHMMIHEAMGLAWGYASDLRRQADVLDRLTESIAEIYEDRAGGTVSQWRAAMAEETWYTAAEAVAAGLADEVSGEDGDGAEAKNRYRDSITAHLVTAMRDRLQEPARVNTVRPSSARAAVPARPAPADDFDVELELARLAVAAAEAGGN